MEGNSPRNPKFIWSHFHSNNWSKTFYLTAADFQTQARNAKWTVNACLKIYLLSFFNLLIGNHFIDYESIGLDNITYHCNIFHPFWIWTFDFANLMRRAQGSNSILFISLNFWLFNSSWHVCLWYWVELKGVKLSLPFDQWTGDIKWPVGFTIKSLLGLAGLVLSDTI